MSQLITIVEDNEDIADLLKYILAEEGYQVEIVPKFEGMEQFMTPRPALIILDEWLNGAVGHEICCEIKRSTELKGIPVLLMSAVSGLEQIAKDCNADGSIGKPFDLNEMIAAVKNVIRSM